MQTLNVNLGDRSYPIYIGQRLLEQSTLLSEAIKGNTVLIVSDSNVAPLYLQQVEETLAAENRRIDSLVLPAGEKNKNLTTLNLVFDALLEKRHARDTTLVALGGGVIGDMTGYAAASYQRGVAFIQIPTTILSQVDSSVGGKTGVNHALGKNMIGAFHQPVAVLADTDTLNTLPQREIAAGLAEVIKYGLLGDIEFLEWLENNIVDLVDLQPAALAYGIERSCQNKARIVAEDEREGGKRALLNLGHTFGHAIETAQSYSGLLHGEAVSVGMVMAADMSHRLGWLSSADVQRTRSVLAAAGLPTAVPDGISAAQFAELMGHDKKVLAGKLRLVLLRQLGDAVISADFDPAALEATLQAFATA